MIRARGSSGDRPIHALSGPSPPKTILAVSAPVAVGDEYRKALDAHAAVDAWRANVRPGGFARRSRPHHPESTARVCETRRPWIALRRIRARAVTRRAPRTARLSIPARAAHTPRARDAAGEMFANRFPERTGSRRRTCDGCATRSRARPR